MSNKSTWSVKIIKINILHLLFEADIKVLKVKIFKGFKFMLTLPIACIAIFI
jgi:hypothetical protein